MCTNAEGRVFFSRDMGITPRDNKTWRVYLDGKLMDTFKVPECEMSISLTNELPCPEPTPTPPPVEELPVTGHAPLTTGPNPVSLIGLVLIAIGAHLRRTRS